MSPDRSTHERESMTPATALHIAATVWGGMLLLLLAVFAFTLLLAPPRLTTTAPPHGDATFMPVLIITILVVSAAGMTHWYLLRRYWKGGLVQPKGYLLASIILWVSITLCAILAQIGAIMDGSLFPNILAAGMLVLLLMSTWPAGHPMIERRTREEEDDDVELFHLPPES